MPGSHHLFRRRLSLEVLRGSARTVDEGHIMKLHQALWMQGT